MKLKNRILYMGLGGIFALMVAFGVAVTMAQTDDDNSPETPAVPDELGRAGLIGQHRFHGRGRAFAGPGMHSEYLAEALGIGVDELETAVEDARAAAIEQAVTDGLLSREDADAILSGEAGPFKRHLGRRGFLGQDGARQTFLADALGISVEELEAAMTEAREAALAQAVEDGLLSEEQLERMEAMRALREFIDRDALLAEALDVPVDEIAAAREAGTLRDLVSELATDRSAFMSAMREAFANAVAEAVDSGIISQELADELSDGPILGFGQRGRFHGFGGVRPDGGGNGFGRGPFGQGRFGPFENNGAAPVSSLQGA